VLMPLDKYEWSNKYGWVQDRYGISWQITLGNKEDVGGSRIVPFFMFVKEQYGKAEDAVKFYTSVFHESSITGILRHAAEAFPEKEGTVKHAQFVLEHQTFMAMESALDHPFSFNEAISLVVNCETQEEIDYYWDNLSKEGDPTAQMCGWLKDKYGVSWQIVPIILDEMLQSADSIKTERVTKAYLKMKRFNIAALKQAFEG
jgi:predicted 3-demethylubiquinone-9 3-methyltransferase (glyoxalase superfamily)